MEQSEQNWLDMLSGQEVVKRIVQFCLSCPVSIKKVYMPDLYKVKQTVQAARGGWYDPHKARQTG